MKKDLLSDTIVIPAGYVSYIETKNLPSWKIALYRYLAQTDGFYPIYVAQQGKLFFSFRKRRSDALNDKDELIKIGISNVQVAEIDKDMIVEVPQKDTYLADMLEDYAKKIIYKEKQIAGLEPTRAGSIAQVIEYLHKALASVSGINPKRYDRLNLTRLEADIEAIINQLNIALAERVPYQRQINVETSPEDLKRFTGYTDVNPESEIRPIKEKTGQKTNTDTDINDSLKRIKDMLKE